MWFCQKRFGTVFKTNETVTQSCGTVAEQVVLCLQLIGTVTHSFGTVKTQCATVNKHLILSMHMLQYHHIICGTVSILSIFLPLIENKC
jgi:hypothetical protein